MTEWEEVEEEESQADLRLSSTPIRQSSVLLRVANLHKYFFAKQKKVVSNFRKKCKTHLSPFAHFQEGADRVKGSCATDVNVGVVVRLQHPDKVITLFLKK